MSGPHTQAGGFNFAHSQLDSQPNYSFADLTQDGTGYGDFSDFSGLTQVRVITALRDTPMWMFRAFSAKPCGLTASTLVLYYGQQKGGSLYASLQDPASQAAWQDAIQASALV